MNGGRADKRTSEKGKLMRLPQKCSKCTIRKADSPTHHHDQRESISRCFRVSTMPTTVLAMYTTLSTGSATHLGLPGYSSKLPHFDNLPAR